MGPVTRGGRVLALLLVLMLPTAAGAKKRGHARHGHRATRASHYSHFNAPQIVRVGQGDGAQGNATVAGRFGFAVLQANQLAPDFDLPNTDERLRGLRDYAGRWLLLNFFATWCDPCAKEMPSLQMLAMGARNKVQVVGVATASNDSVSDYGRRLGLTFPLLFDGDGSVARAYGVGSYPTTFLIDPRGMVVGVYKGGRDWRQAMNMFYQLR